MTAPLRDEHRQLLGRECVVGILVNAIVPPALPLRALVLAARSAVLLVPLGLLLVAVAGLAPFTATSANVFNVAFGALVGAVASAPIVKLALAD